MKKRLVARILVLTVPVLFLTAWFLSSRVFSLALENEKSRTQMIESIVYREVRDVMAGLDFTRAASYARQYREYFSPQGVELVFCWNGTPIADAELPSEKYKEMLQGQRCAMLDTLSPHQIYAVAEPIDSRLTLVLLRDVDSLYRLRRSFRETAMAVAAAASLLIAGGAMYAAGMATRPVRKLTEAAKALAADTGHHVEIPTVARDEIGTLALAFSEMQAAVENRETRLEEESEARQRMLDALAHEMRTPLTSLLGNTRLLQQDLSPEDRKKISDSMAKEIRRLSDMDQVLMKLSSLPHDPPELEPVQVKPLLQETAVRLQERAGDIRLETAGEDSVIQGDRELLSLLADNLTLNAVHASSPGMTVTLTAEPRGFSVRDRGVGMTEEELRHACEPFWKADKARTRRHGGAGLGLSLCLRVAELHQGSLSFDSAPGRGTLVTFTALPEGEKMEKPAAGKAGREEEAG